jgi:hypothetical protein
MRFTLSEAAVDLDNIITGTRFEYDALNRLYDLFEKFFKTLTEKSTVEIMIFWECFDRSEKYKMPKDVLDEVKRLHKNLMTYLVFKTPAVDLEELRDYYLCLSEQILCYEASLHDMTKDQYKRYAYNITR